MTNAESSAPAASGADVPPPPRPAGPARRWSAGRIVVVVVGSVLAVVGVLSLVAGGILTWAATTQRDDAGYFHTDTARFTSGSYAIVSDDIDLGTDARPRDWGVDLGDLLRVRLRAWPADRDAPLFVGIARTGDTERFLGDVAYDEIRDVDVDPFRAGYRSIAGDREPGAPGDEDFWVASSDGAGRRTVVWEPRGGHWTVVVMNADAGRGVAADVNVGVKIRHLWTIVGGLLGAGALLLALGIVLIVVGSRGRSAPTSAASAPTDRPIERAAPPAVPDRDEPVVLFGRVDEPLSRWRWIVKWILAIPHFVVLALLWLAALLLTIVAGIAILFTGRYPRRIFDFNVGVMRWTWRVAFYATAALGTDRYPPFTLGSRPDYPADLDVAYPQQLSRGLVLVKWWLLALPHYVITGIIGTGWWWGSLRVDDDRWSPLGWGTWGGGLLGILVLVAGVRLLFSERYPREMFDLIMGLNRWVARVAVYALLMTDRYPPFRLDPGGGTAPVPPSQRAQSAGDTP